MSIAAHVSFPRGVFLAWAIGMSVSFAVEPVHNITLDATYSTIAAAVAAARTDDEIVVAPGVYEENITIGKRIVLRSENPADPAIVAATVIDAGGRKGEWSAYNCVKFSGSGANGAQLLGFTLQNGWSHYVGGAVWISGTSPVISDNVIQNSRQEQMVYYGGGGICVTGGGAPIITRNLIRNNRAMRGGGIFADDTARPIVYDNRFEGNYAAYVGGGIMVDSKAGVRKEDGTDWPRFDRPIMPEDTNTYADNLHGTPAVDTGGADVYFLDGGVHNTTQDTWHATLQAAIDAAVHGDEIVAYPRNYPAVLDFKGKNVTLRSLDPSNPDVVAATTIEGNVMFFRGETNAAKLQGFTIRNGQSQSGGGGIWIAATSPHIVDNVIINNRHTGTGGEDYGGGGIKIAYESANPIIERNVIAGNSASRGGGIFIHRGSARIKNNEIFDNSSTGVGGGISLYKATSTLSLMADNVIAGNTALAGGGISLSESWGCIRGNVIAGNRAANAGGGISLPKWSYVYGHEDDVALNLQWPYAHVPPAGEPANTYGVDQATGGIQVEIIPAAARAAGALWSDDGVAWHESGTSVNRQAGGLNAHGDPALHTTGSDVYAWGAELLPVEPVAVPEHIHRTIQFSALEGWHSPTEITVLPVYGQNRKVAAVYTRMTGAVQVTLEPEAARTDGVLWRVANYAWTASDGVVDALPTGQYTLEFRGTDLWFPPDPMTVTVTADATTTVTRSFYTKTATVSGIVAANKTYDGTVAAVLDVSGAVLVGVEEGDSVSLATGQAAGAFDTAAAGVGKTVAVSGLTLSGAEAPLYKLIQPTTTADITPRPLEVAAHDKQKVYGEPDPELTWEFSNGTLAAGDALSGSLLREPGEQAGIYPIGQGDLAAGDNYTLGFIAGQLTIAKATPVIDWPLPTPIVYGTPLGPAQLNAAANVAGKFTYTPPEGTVPAAGPARELRVGFAPTEHINWNAAAAAVAIDVTPAPLTCTATDLKKVLGSPNPPLRIRYTGLQNADPGPATPPTATCGADHASPLGTYPIALAGGVDPNYDLTLQDGQLTVVEGEFVSVWLDDGSREPVPGPDFGETHHATGGFDDGLDMVADEGDGVRVYLLNETMADPARQKLLRDYRPIASVNRWRLVVENTAGRDTPLVLHWNTDAAAAPDRVVFLQQLFDEQPVGFPIDMRTNDSLAVAGDAEFEIAYAPLLDPAPVLTLGAGWNLAGSPAMSMQSVDDVLDNGARSPLNIGPVWYWNETGYNVWDRAEPFSPERAFWLYCTFDAQTVPITGVRADGIVILKPGWNLVSPARDCVMTAVDGIGARAWYWHPRLGAYRSVAVGDVLETGLGYWFYVWLDVPVRADIGAPSQPVFR